MGRRLAGLGQARFPVRSFVYYRVVSALVEGSSRRSETMRVRMYVAILGALLVSASCGSGPGSDGGGGNDSPETRPASGDEAQPVAGPSLITGGILEFEDTFGVSEKIEVESLHLIDVDPSEANCGTESPANLQRLRADIVITLEPAESGDPNVVSNGGGQVELDSWPAIAVAGSGQYDSATSDSFVTVDDDNTSLYSRDVTYLLPPPEQPTPGCEIGGYEYRPSSPTSEASVPVNYTLYSDAFVPAEFDPSIYTFQVSTADGLCWKLTDLSAPPDEDLCGAV